MANLLVLGDEITVAAGAGNSTTVDNATVVRVLNASGSTVQIYCTGFLLCRYWVFYYVEQYFGVG